MINIENFYKFLGEYKGTGQQIDVAHNCLIFGVALSSKPENVLELGIGSGYVTRAILYALKFNGKGKLTSVDNWHDWKGKEPAHIEGLRKQNVNVVVMDEGRFVKSQPDNSYDFLISDGDHHRAGGWAKDVFRIVKAGGIIFVHDVSKGGYSSLRRYAELSKEKRLAHFIFSKSSRKRERCNRGLLMVQNGE